MFAQKNKGVSKWNKKKCLKEMGRKHIACLTIENIPPETLRAYRIADNQLTRSTEFDPLSLKKEFEFLYDYKIFGTDLGFTALKVDQIYNYKIEDPKSKKEKTEEEVCDWEQKNIPQRVKLGDLWRLGDHFLLCADSLNPTSFEVVMQGELAQIVLTDAPYNVPISRHVCGLGKIKHEEFAMASGEMTDEEFEKNFVSPYMQNCIQYSKDGSLHLHFIDWRGLRI